MDDLKVMKRTHPILDDLTRPFWNGARNGRILVPKCSNTGELQWPPRLSLADSGKGGLVWESLSGRGKVYSYSVVYRSSHAVPDVPYVLALIELDEGPSIVSNIVDTDPDKIEIGMRVQVKFEEVDDEISLPVFSGAL